MLEPTRLKSGRAAATSQAVSPGGINSRPDGAVSENGSAARSETSAQEEVRAVLMPKLDHERHRRHEGPALVVLND